MCVLFLAKMYLKKMVILLSRLIRSLKRPLNNIKIKILKHWIRMRMRRNHKPHWESLDGNIIMADIQKKNPPLVHNPHKKWACENVLHDNFSLSRKVKLNFSLYLVFMFLCDVLKYNRESILSLPLGQRLVSANKIDPSINFCPG